jgi:hypothetical protein
MSRMRGCRPSQPETLLTGIRRTRHVLALPPPPEEFDATGEIDHFDMLGNDKYGDCVFAEEASYKRCVRLDTGLPDFRISAETCVKDYLVFTGGQDNGAEIHAALDWFEHVGLIDDNRTHHLIGPHGALNCRHMIELQHGISLFRGVKIAVAADVLDRHVGRENGWLCDRRGRGPIDHCVGLLGYGSVAYCLQVCGHTGNITPRWHHLPGFVLYTWGTIGVITWPSLLSIIGEAWVRVTDPDRGDSSSWNPTADEYFSAVVA